MKHLFTLSLTLSFLLAQEVSIEKVLIEENVPTVDKSMIQVTKQQDLAEILSKLTPEINIVRASAIGNDIVLRGFKRDDVNVLIDGAKIYGACPNRMDPPAMHISASSIEEVKIKEGPFDEENFGSMGGMIDVKTKDAKLGQGYQLGVTYGSFGYNKFEAKANLGDEKLKFSLGVSKENSDQYKEGSGKSLVEQNRDRLGKEDPYAYQTRYKDLDAYSRDVIYAKMKYSLSSNQELKLSLLTDKAINVLYPAFQMDAQLDKTLMINGTYSIKNLSSFSKELTILGYYSTVAHDMGTKFRNAANNPMLYRTHHVESRIKGVKLKNSFEVGGIVWRVGVDTSKRNWNGICVSEPSKRPKQVRIPDVDTINKALFLSAMKRVADMRIKVGLRYDDTSIKAHRFQDPTIVNRAAIQNYYRAKGSKRYYDISANIIIDYSINSDNTLFISLGQGVRVPDAQELYFIGFMKGNWTRRGNPELKETKNREIDLGIKSSLFDTDLKTTLFYSKLKDYIYGYRTNVGNADLTKYYLTWSNIDAHIYGVSVELAKSFGDFWLVESSLAYQRGRKDELISSQSDRDLAQIPPLHGRVALTYDDGNINLLGEMLFSSGWSDYDSDNGERAIGGWGVANIKVSKDLSDTIKASFGIDNIFDKAYVLNNTYVGRSLIGGRIPVLINEPGRFIYANLNISF